MSDLKKIVVTYNYWTKQPDYNDSTVKRTCTNIFDILYDLGNVDERKLGYTDFDDYSYFQVFMNDLTEDEIEYIMKRISKYKMFKSLEIEIKNN